MKPINKIITNKNIIEELEYTSDDEVKATLKEHLLSNEAIIEEIDKELGSALRNLQSFKSKYFRQRAVEKIAKIRIKLKQKILGEEGGGKA